MVDERMGEFNSFAQCNCFTYLFVCLFIHLFELIYVDVSLQVRLNILVPVKVLAQAPLLGLESCD